MRENEYRVWDNHTKTFIYFGGAPTFDDTENTITFKCSAVLGERDPDGTRFVFQRNTGLHDKNGKEIYEGDIIEATDNWAEDNVPRYLVKWFVDDTNCGFELVHPENDEYEECLADDYGLYPLEIERSGLAVIGNIYQNSDLLK